jgi:hypothetical protein
VLNEILGTQAEVKDGVPKLSFGRKGRMHVARIGALRALSTGLRSLAFQIKLQSTGMLP